MIHVFAGPTISARDVQARLPGALVSGPAAFGDVYCAARQKPTAIAIIDGYFERVPATWHKEILWAMSEGVHVFGASSMGALRAAELCDFGMVGVGAIFEAFCDGELEDDDEVAIAHSAADTGFVPVSEAMVNIRATLRRAATADVISSVNAEALTALAKRMFYAQRCYPALLEAAADAGLSSAELGRFRVWIATGHVDQKRADAEQLLEHLAAWQAGSPQPKRVQYRFEATDAWREAERVASERLRETSSLGAALDDGLLEELKLDGAYRAQHAEAAAFGWSLDAARRAGVRPDALAIRTAVESFRRDSGLTERRAFEAWREAQHIDDAALARFFEERARASWAEPLGEALGRQHLAHQLRASGSYSRYRERAALKAQRLQQLGLDAPSLADAKLDEAELWRWFFEQRAGLALPKDLDIFSRTAGFSNTDELRRAAVREFCFQARSAPAAEADDAKLPDKS